MKVLSVASELFPLIKTGGLADVAGALPHALNAHGVQTKTLLPAYPSVLKAVGKTRKKIQLGLLFGEMATVFEAQHEGLEVLLLHIPAFYDRPGGPYIDATGKDFSDNWKRFAALSLAAAQIAAGVLPGWKPDVVHVHDWQAAMTPVFMRYSEAAEVPSLITIHNIAFQGQFSADLFPELGLPSHAFMEALEYYGSMSFLKGGLTTAHALSTVSPSYAEEILVPQFGMGLEGVIASRADDLYGIANGIDTTVWNPVSDPMIATNFAVGGLKKRAQNRKALCARMNLDNDKSPIFCIISRLTWQKGMDLVAEVADDLVAMGGKLAILGSGDAGLEGALYAAAGRHPGRIGMVVGYNEPLSHLMQAGSDAILIPSRFEPCGLTQLYALRYGCVPVVARTGGLNDTVIDANEAALSAGVATGVQFGTITADGLRHALRRTLRLHGEDKIWGQMQKQGMKSDVSWGRSAARYFDLYVSLAAKGQ